MMHNMGMPIARINHGSAPRLGVVVDDELALLDLELRSDQGVEALLSEGAKAAGSLIDAALQSRSRIPLAASRLTSPVPRPQKIFAVGLNYKDHIAESGMAAPEVPNVFAKYVNTVSGPTDSIQRPRVSEELDYEGEFGVVIGTRCRHVPRERAHEVIGGYLVANDVSVRDWQRSSPQWTMGKSFDTHCPIGPWLTLADEIDADGLQLRTWVNGELRQDSNTRNLVFGASELIAFLSQACTLEPGDIILTGTPSGVGGAMGPPLYLAAGDEVRVEIAGLGAITNPVVDEPPAAAHSGLEQMASSN
jgi:2-keto-4-pentenoate hydratase/2-oxohepta-3-ene-1,7-dioic acid hydratase in catechol pathway